MNLCLDPSIFKLLSALIIRIKSKIKFRSVECRHSVSTWPERFQVFINVALFWCFILIFEGNMSSNYREAFLGLCFGCQTSSKLFNMRASPVTLAETVFIEVHIAKQLLDSRCLKNAIISSESSVFH